MVSLVRNYVFMQICGTIVTLEWTLMGSFVWHFEASRVAEVLTPREVKTISNSSRMWPYRKMRSKSNHLSTNRGLRTGPKPLREGGAKGMHNKIFGHRFSEHIFLVRSITSEMFWLNVCVSANMLLWAGGVWKIQSYGDGNKCKPANTVSQLCWRWLEKYTQGWCLFIWSWCE